MNREAFGRRLYNIRRERSMTADKFADVCNLNAVFIRQIERATKLPSLPTFVLICNALSVSPVYLLADSLDSMKADEHASDLCKKVFMLTPSQQNIIEATIDAIVYNKE